MDQDSINPLVPAGFDIAWSVVAALPLILAVVALVGVVMSSRYTAGGKVLWAVAVVALPVLGSVAWFAFGNTARLRTDLP